MILAPFALLALLLGARASAQDVPSRDVVRVHEHFLTAFNAGSDSALRSFVTTYGAPPRNIERDVGYWRAVRAEVGALRLLYFDRQPRSNREAIIGWYYGVTTGAYPGIELMLDSSSSRLRFYGVNRATRPPRAPNPQPVKAAARGTALEEYFRTSSDSGHFSGAAMVIERGRVLFQGAYGFADLASGRRNTTQTPFMLASVTKILTGIAILQLVDRRLLTVADPIGKWLPELPEALGRAVTIRHLLTHTSGIELDGDDGYVRRLRETRTVADLLSLQAERLSHLPQYSGSTYVPPGSFDYTNEGIDLLGAIVERVSGENWSDYLAKHIFGPLGLRNSGVAPGGTGGAGGNLATGYTIRDTLTGVAHGAERVPAPPTFGSALRPAGSGFSSVEDLGRLMSALVEGKLVSLSSLRAMTSEQVQLPVPPGLVSACRRGYGFTMSVTTCPNGAGVGHTGSAYGMSTVVEHFPESGITVVLLSNFDRAANWAHLHTLELLGLR